MKWSFSRSVCFVVHICLLKKKNKTTYYLVLSMYDLVCGSRFLIFYIVEVLLCILSDGWNAY